MVKTIVTGHLGSKELLPASSFLFDRYMPIAFDDVTWASFGPEPEKLYRGHYVSWGDEQIGGADAWSKYHLDYLSQLGDEHILYGMDDFLIGGHPDMLQLQHLLSLLDDNIVCARLCTSDFYKDFTMLDDVVKLLGPQEYTATGQYCIWNREYLCHLLAHTKSPWEFEATGTRMLNQEGKKVIGTDIPTLPYNDRSSTYAALGNKITVKGLQQEDVDLLVKKGMLPKERLVNE